ncbi:c-type cytochrome [Roseibium suaedae]|uniref:Cytochrome c n=1 Tax=Roseibium suaedae TaxID=735517 RepID=A0A1M7FBZ7_9HYPH|nr:cytochrome c [Roseibium suaedae]SHM01475.1 cytochrome c [Roseibium suaedae]
MSKSPKLLALTLGITLTLPFAAVAAGSADTAKTFGLGRPAEADEIAAWDIDVRPDGTGLPEGSGTVAEGEVLFTDNCATCHGDFGEGAGRWPVLAGGQDTLKEDRPEKTIGSYWPYLSTVYDYVRRAMPYGNARSLSDDEVYALTAYLLYLNDVVTDEEFKLSKENFTGIHLPNEANFIADDRMAEAHNANKGDPCMTNCMAEPARITMHARVLDVTPGAGDDETSGGSVD